MAWLCNWKKRVKLTIDNNDIDSALIDFPILIYLSASSGRNSDDISCVFDELGNNDNRKKIAVTKNDGTTQCYVEIERWDHANEKAWLHIKVPNISSSSDTDLYLYYDSNQSDNTTYVGDVEERTEVWNSNYKGVYHLGELISGVTDWKSPGTCANVDRNGRNSWFNPDNAKLSDNSRAACDVGINTYGDWLRCTNFGFTVDDIPSGATIIGIEAKIERQAEEVNDIDDSAVYLRKTSGQVGDNKESDTYWTTSDVTASYGGSTDDWNAGLVDTDIVANNDFGIDISAYNADALFNRYARIDHVQIRIYYKMVNTTDWKSPGTVVNIDRSGGPAWSNPDNAKISDNNDTIVSIDGVNNSDWLRCTNFGFISSDIPSGKVIIGIEMKIEHRASNPGDTWDNALYLRKTSGQIGDNKADVTVWSTTEEIFTYGGSSDSWNSGLIDTDIVDNSDFGLDFSAHNDWSAPEDAEIDHIQIRIHYCDKIMDSTSNNNDGIPSEVVRVDGQIGYGQNFNGDTSEIDCASKTAIDNIFAGGGTLEAWIYPESWGENGYGRILDKASSTGSADGWNWGVIGSVSSVYLEHEFSGSTPSWDSETVLSLDELSHVVVTYDSDSPDNEPQFIINGQLTTTNEVTAPSGSAVSDAAQSMTIGNHGAIRTFDGIIDEVRISNIKRSVDWAKATYESQRGTE